MSKTNNFVFTGLHIIAWIIFVGLSVEAGALIVNFFFSVFKPEFVGNLYQNLDLSEMYAESRSAFYNMYSFVLTIAILKAILFYMLVILLYKLDLSKPFSSFVSKQILQISYYTFSIGLISYVAREFARSLEHHGLAAGKLHQFTGDSQAFILMAGVIYVIGVIFAKGIELQEESDLTV